MIIENSERKYKLGIFLGTFDPIHNGHIHIAKNVLEEVGLDSVMIIPSYDSPHKSDSVCTCSEERLIMCELATRDLDFITASDIEIKNKLEGYSLKKIDMIYDNNPEAKLYYIIGSDAYVTIGKWNNLKALISKVSFCVVVRDSDAVYKVEEVKSELEVLGGETYICNFETLEISSTNIREKIRGGECISDLLPKTVEKYILTNNLYKAVMEK